jgi:hypothetical protein
MKPGSRDIKYAVLITGLELEELQRHTWQMAESFGLDHRIAEYQGKRPLGLYRWDLECLQDVMEMALQDPDEYPDHSTPGYAALCNLYERVRQLCVEAFK